MKAKVRKSKDTLRNLRYIRTRWPEAYGGGNLNIPLPGATYTAATGDQFEVVSVGHIAGTKEYLVTIKQIYSAV